MEDSILEFLYSIRFLFLIVGLWLYFLPSFIANSRKHHALIGIVIVNIIAGWTLIGWVACLIWAYGSTNAAAQTVVNKFEFSLADEISKLADLKEKGLLTEDEFTEKKQQLLKQ